MAQSKKKVKNAEQFSNLRVAFEPNVDYRFRKIFEDIDSAEKFVFSTLRPSEMAGDVVEHVIDICHEWHEHKIIVDELLRHIPTGVDLKTIRVKSDRNDEMVDKCEIKLQIKLLTDPHFERAENAYSTHEKQMSKVREINTAEWLESGHSMEFSYRWTASVQVRLVAIACKDEVKVAGQPYQPASEEEIVTEWFSTYRLMTNSYHSTLTINQYQEYVGERYNKVKEVLPGTFTLQTDTIRVVITSD